MTNQKDNDRNSQQNKAITTNTSHDVANYYNVFNHGDYVSLANHSQKIVTAIYMISDFLESDDPMRKLLRETSTAIMQKLFNLIHAEKMNRVEQLSLVQNMLVAERSYFEIVYQNGFISDMNYQLVQREMNSLITHIKQLITKSLPYDNKQNNSRSVREFSFREDFFTAGEAETQQRPQSSIKETSNAETADIKNQKDTEVDNSEIKKTSIEDTPVFVKKTSIEEAYKRSANKRASRQKQSGETKKRKKRKPQINEAKEERKENIVKILKQKRNASIKDIAKLFKDCSTKTIQRDLTDLIDEGVVIKEGSRRWSRYNLSY